MRNSDAYVKQEGTTWTFGTASVERTVALEDGRLLLKSFKIKGREVAAPDELLAGRWELVSSDTNKLKHGELELRIALQQGPLKATKVFVIYPKSSVIREWVSFTNTGDAPLQVVEPEFLNLGVRLGGSPDFHWMTGGENQPGSWTLKTESLTPGKTRTFDSYEPLPADHPEFPGDGIRRQDHAERSAGLARGGLAVRPQRHRHCPVRCRRST